MAAAMLGGGLMGAGGPAMLGEGPPMPQMQAAGALEMITDMGAKLHVSLAPYVGALNAAAMEEHLRAEFDSCLSVLRQRLQQLTTKKE
jgi:hypothetical protein